MHIKSAHTRLLIEIKSNFYEDLKIKRQPTGKAIDICDILIFVGKNKSNNVPWTTSFHVLRICIVFFLIPSSYDFVKWVLNFCKMIKFFLYLFACPKY